MIEVRLVITSAAGYRVGRGMRVPSEVMDLFYIFVWVMITCIKINLAVHLKFVFFTVCKLYHKKKLNETNQKHSLNFSYMFPWSS